MSRARVSGPPPLFLTLCETLRSSMEFSTLMTSAPLLWNAPRGERRKVIVLPGFSLDDTSTLCLRNYLSWLGHEVHGFGMGANFGPRTLGPANHRLDAMIDRVAGEDQVVLIGHSLGGVLSRDYARRNPDRVSRVICLGSPFAGDETSMHKGIVWLRRNMCGEDPGAPVDRSPLPVPHTVIYSDTDGVVSGFDCRDTSEDHDNVEIVGSHIGLVVNPEAFRVIAERLARVATGRGADVAVAVAA